MLKIDRTRPYFTCRRLRLLEYLRGKGFYPIRVLPDVNNPRFNVWLFETSDELADALEAYPSQY